MIESLVSLIGGGILRIIPETLSFFDKKNERSHELSMVDKQIALKQAEATNALNLEQEKHLASIDSGMIDALIKATEVQGRATGIKIVDALNALVRPVITYAYFSLYAAVRVCMMVVAMSRAPEPITALISSWTSEDSSMLFGILGFWFVNRSIEKRK